MEGDGWHWMFGFPSDANLNRQSPWTLVLCWIDPRNHRLPAIRPSPGASEHPPTLSCLVLDYFILIFWRYWENVYGLMLRKAEPSGHTLPQFPNICNFRRHFGWSPTWANQRQSQIRSKSSPSLARSTCGHQLMGWMDNFAGRLSLRKLETRSGHASKISVQVAQIKLCLLISSIDLWWFMFIDYISTDWEGVWSPKTTPLNMLSEGAWSCRDS